MDPEESSRRVDAEKGGGSARLRSRAVCRWERAGSRLEEEEGIGRSRNRVESETGEMAGRRREETRWMGASVRSVVRKRRRDGEEGSPEGSSRGGEKGGRTEKKGLLEDVKASARSRRVESGNAGEAEDATTTGGTRDEEAHEDAGSQDEADRDGWEEERSTEDRVRSVGVRTEPGEEGEVAGGGEEERTAEPEPGPEASGQA